MAVVQQKVILKAYKISLQTVFKVVNNTYRDIHHF